MTRRMVDSGMWSNESFAALPAMARLLQIGIINHADDQGRIKAHPAYLRSQIFPYDDVAIDDITKWLQLITQNGTAIIYEVDGKEYLQLVKWWDYQSLQYASPSEYPAPGAWLDHIRFNAKGAPNLVLTFNWTTTKGDTLPDTCDARGNPPSYPPGALGGDQASAPVAPPNQLNLTKLNTTKNKSNHSSADGEHESTLSELVFDRLEEEWTTVNPSQHDNHMELAKRYGYKAWVAGLERCPRGKRSKHAYVEKAILSAIDDNPGLAQTVPKPSGERYYYTDPVTGITREVVL